MNWVALFWLILMVVFIVMESCSVAVISIWFAVGALVAMILSLFSVNIWIQVVAFLAVSIMLLLLLRTVVRKQFAPKLVPTNVDSLIGANGYVTVYVDNMAGTGQVKLGSQYWTARSTGNEPIPEGSFIRVDRIEGVKVFVSLVEVSVP